MNTELTDRKTRIHPFNTFATEAVKASLNVADDRGSVLALIPDDSYKKKLEMIEKAPDLSTAEKLAALEHAENKRLADLQQGTEIHKDLLWNKTSIILTVSAGLALILAPGGAKLLQKTIKRCA